MVTRPGSHGHVYAFRRTAGFQMRFKELKMVHTCKYGLKIYVHKVKYFADTNQYLVTNQQLVTPPYFPHPFKWCATVRIDCHIKLIAMEKFKGKSRNAVLY